VRSALLDEDEDINNIGLFNILLPTDVTSFSWTPSGTNRPTRHGAIFEFSVWNVVLNYHLNQLWFTLHFSQDNINWQIRD